MTRANPTRPDYDESRSYCTRYTFTLNRLAEGVAARVDVQPAGSLPWWA